METILNVILSRQAMEEAAAVKKLILQKLIRGNIWGGKHTPIDFVKKGIPEHYRNTHAGQRIVEGVLKELANIEWITILHKRTGKGSAEHVSLNPRKVQEIMHFLENTAE